MTQFLEPDDDTSLADPITIADILHSIEGDCALLTREERLNAPIELVEAELIDHSWNDFAIDEDGLLAAMRNGTATALADTIQPDADPFPAPRSALRAQVSEALADHHCILLAGSHGSGKSYLIQQLLEDRAFRAGTRRVIMVDCAALRMSNAQMFGREAVWAYFGSDDEGYRRFLADNVVGQKDNVLVALIEKQLARGGLIVFDHAEKLSASNEIDVWFGELFAKAAGLGVKILVVHTTPVELMRAAFRELRQIEVPSLSIEELYEWAQQPRLSQWAGLPVKAIRHFTGGRPPLLNDFSLFLLKNEKFGPKGVLRAFAQWRTHDGQFFGECEKLIRSARQFPEIIARLISNEGLPPDGWDINGLPPTGIAALRASGAARLTEKGRLALVSPLYVRRLRSLSSPEALAALAVRTDFHQIETSSSWKTLRRFGELASDALAKALGYESSPVVGLQRLITLMLRWEFKAQIHIRDPDNARLWSPFDRPEGIGPLECWRQPDFSRAAQTGQIVRAEDGRVFVPVISYSGTATMVIALLPINHQSKGPCTQRVDIERATGIIKGIQPTLGQLVQRMALRRERKLKEKLFYRSRSNQSPSGEALSGLQSLLREVGCRSIVVLELQSEKDRPGIGTWMVSRFQRTSMFDEGTRWTEGLSARRLNAILRHRSQRGLVLSGEAAVDAFPRLAQQDATLFCNPVIRDGRQTIVVFLFGAEGLALDGALQWRLSTVAPELLKAA